MMEISQLCVYLKMYTEPEEAPLEMKRRNGSFHFHTKLLIR